MNKQIYVNLPVKNLNRTKEFFSSLGFAFKPEFTNENAACMVVSDVIYVMLLTESFFLTFTPKAIADTSKTTEVLLCLSCDSRAQVDELVAKAVAAGGKTPRVTQDHGFMYGHSFEDLDGHIWELMYMDPNAKPNA
jgi:predicted lactoylglutathione lyase